MIRCIVLASVFLVLGLMACAKVDDLGHLQDEGVAAAKSYTPRLDELQHRADAILARGADAARGSDPNETVRARALLDRAMQIISELRSRASVAPAEITAAGKAGNFEDLERKIDELRHHMDKGTVEANADLDAVEGWLAQAEVQAKTAPGAPEPEPTETAPESGSAEPPAGEPVAGQNSDPHNSAKAEPKTEPKKPTETKKQPEPKPKQPAKP